MHLGHQTAVRANVNVESRCDSLGVPTCIFNGFILKIASHMRVGLYVSDMGKTLPETNLITGFGPCLDGVKFVVGSLFLGEGWTQRCCCLYDIEL